MQSSALENLVDGVARAVHGQAGEVQFGDGDRAYDGHAAVDGGFTYRMVHIWPDFLAR